MTAIVHTFKLSRVVFVFPYGSTVKYHALINHMVIGLTVMVAQAECVVLSLHFNVTVSQRNKF